MLHGGGQGLRLAGRPAILLVVLRALRVLGVLRVVLGGLLRLHGVLDVLQGLQQQLREEGGGRARGAHDGAQHRDDELQRRVSKSCSLVFLRACSI